jgi:ornithine carbamoyltransferase
MKHLLSMLDISKKELLNIIKLAQKVKKNPKKYHNKLYEKTLMTFFQAPSLRTEVSFDVAMFQTGGEIIDYHAETSPWAKGKESIEDVSRVVSRYCDAIMIRMHNHQDIVKFAKYSRIPVINGLSTQEHPCQIIGDFLTILEKKKRLSKLKLAYVGDANNNVTHSLILGCALLGLNMSIGCPSNKEFMPQPSVLRQAHRLAKKSQSKIEVTKDPYQAVKNADIIYTDSWMSYRIDKSQEARRIKILKPYQVNLKLLNATKKDVLFMHCLPAKRGQEVTKDVIDGKKSIVFDQAENRLHSEKAILLKLLIKK